MEINRTTVFAAVGTVSVAVLGYCVYFDYRRRHDVEFRRAIKREHKRLAGIEREKQRRAEVGEEEAVLDALRQAKATPLATSAEDREQAFMQEVARGEQLYAEGESQKYEAAICFWRALKMYPQPAELTRIYEQTIPPVSILYPPVSAPITDMHSSPQFVFKVVLKMVELESTEQAESLNEVVE